MCVPCTLSAMVVKTLYQSMRTLLRQLKKKTSGQGAKPGKSGPKRTSVSAHLCIRADHSQLGKVQTPALQVDLAGEDEGGDDEDAASVNSSQAPSQLPISAQAGPSQPSDRRPPRPGASGSGRKLG